MGHSYCKDELSRISAFRKKSHPILKWVFFINAVFISKNASAEVVQLSETDLPQLIESKNNHALGAKEHVKAAEKQTGHLRRSFLPTIEAKAGIERFKTGDFDPDTQPFGGLEAKLNIFNAGKDSLEEKIRSEQLQSQKAKSSLVLREEIKKARKVFWNLVFQTEHLSLLEGALKENDKNLKSATGRIRAGAATGTDRLEFEMYQLELEQEHAQTKLSIENLRREFATLVGLEPSKFETPKAVDHDHDDKLLSATLNPAEHPDVSSISSQATIAGLKRTQSRRSWLPKMDLFASQSLYTFREREYADQSNRWETVYGIQLSMELYNGGTSYADRASLAAETLGFEKEAAQTRAELMNEFESAKAELKLTHQLLHDSEASLQRNSQYLSRSMDEYRRGVKNSLDILNVSQRTLTVRKRYAEIRRDYHLARADLLATLGQ